MLIEKNNIQRFHNLNWVQWDPEKPTCNNCQAPGPGLDQPGPWSGQHGQQQSLGQPHQQPDPNLAVILTTLRPGVDTIIKQATTTPPPHHHH